MTTDKLVAVAFVALVACDPNQAGNTGSTKLGDTSHPATRGSPLAELQDACGSGSMLRSLARNPYLQQVTQHSGIVGWLADTSDTHGVEITTPEGTPVQVGPGTPDLGTLVWSRFDTLEPDTIYCYRVLVGGQPVTDRIGFRTAPSPDSERTIGVLAFGDSGGGSSDQYALRAQMEEVPYQLMIHTGDLAYESGTAAQIEESVFAVYDELLRHIPFYPAAGNHDHKTASAAPFREVFNLPDNGGGETWYSYDWGRIHFAVLDTEADYATQAEWLAADLAASPLPWKIVYLHRPPYSSGNHGSDTGLRQLLAPVVEQHGVQLVLAGHDHHYERMIPQNGVQYIVTGGGGRGTYSVGESGFTAFSEPVIHYVYLEVGVDELVLHAIDAEGIEFDSAVVPR